MKQLITGLVVATLVGHAEAQTCLENVTRTAPDSRYELQNSGAEVWDKQTDLIWQRCSLGQSWDGNTCAGAAMGFSWQHALEAAKAAGGGWTLPNKRELQSLMEWACREPIVNVTVFPNTLSYWYWTSSSVAGRGDSVWIVNLYHGDDYYDSKIQRQGVYGVLLVRARQ